MVIDELTLVTDDGDMPTWVYHPGIHAPYPVVMYLMDAPSIRPALHEMASRLATAGYYVMMPYLYYRCGPYREFTRSDDDMHTRQRYMQTVNPTNILVDAAAMLSYADADPAASTDHYGAVGFCMSGGLTVALAKNDPERMSAAASIHGAWLVREGLDSPHLGLDAVTAECYFAWCDQDATAPIDDRDAMIEALNAAHVYYTLDFFTTALHGFAPYGGPNYDRTASEQHWARVHDLLHRRLQSPTET